MKTPPKMLWSAAALVLFAAMIGSIAGLNSEKANAAKPADAAAKSVLMLVQNPKQMKVVLDTCRELQADHNVPHTKVIVCGPASAALVKESEAAEAIKEAVAADVQIEVCGISLKKLEIAEDQLAPGVAVVANGLISAVETKSAGWISVDL